MLCFPANSRDMPKALKRGGPAMTSPYTGNILGATRAEADGHMLGYAFVETSEYRSLTESFDF